MILNFCEFKIGVKTVEQILENARSRRSENNYIVADTIIVGLGKIPRPPMPKYVYDEMGYINL